MDKFVLGLLLGLALAVSAAVFEELIANSYQSVSGTPVKKFVAGTDTCYYIYGKNGAAISCK